MVEVLRRFAVMQNFTQCYGRSTSKVCSHAKFTQYYGRSSSKIYDHVNLRNIMVEVLRKLASGNFLRLVNISKYFDVILRFIEVLCKFKNRKNINLLHYSLFRIPRYLVLLHDLLAKFIFLIITI